MVSDYVCTATNGKKMYKLNLNSFAILIIVCDITSALKREPRIFTRNGHLSISVDYNKNINLLVSGEGGVKINNEDIVKLINSVKNVSNLIDSFSKSIPTNPNGNQIVPFSQNFVQRIDILEQNFNNYTSTTKGVLLRVKRRLNVMQRNLRNIMVSLSTNECDKSPCLNGGTCQDLYKTFSCTCPKGWEGPVCDKDVNECAIFAGTDLGCQNGATCTNKPGTYECVCPIGFFGTHCTTKTIDCYASGKDLCGHGSCVSQATGYKCFCDQGWTTDGKNPACTVDVNECDSKKLPCSTNPLVQCINVPGSFYCGHCPQGYTGNGYYCNDIDECQVFNGGCSVNPMVQCINTPGSRMCGLCPPGYLGNGVTCTYQGSVCNVNNGGCHPLAQCRDNPRVSSSFVECICPRGYSGNGVGPSGCIQSTTLVDPCASNPCVYGSCSVSNTTGDYVCFCRRRYTGRNCDIRKSTCLSSPCLNGGTCIDILGISYRCQCTSQYVGNNCQMEKQSCGGKLDSYDGVLQFPADQTEQYKHSLSCAWVIQTNSTKVLNITFTKFDLEDSSECQYDWLQIHDGRNSAAHMIGRFCGSKLPKGGNIVTTTNLIYIWFRSDTRHAKDGFSLNWTTTDPVCGSTIFVTTYGTIQSPGYPGNYPSNRDCYWTIIVSKSKRLEFHFFTVTLGNDVNCTGDYLEFYYESVKNENRFAQYCSSSLPTPLTSPSNKVIVYFHSDSNVSSGSFQISYKPISRVPNCGGVFTTKVGVIVNPALSASYQDMQTLECEYLIKVENMFRIQVEFTAMKLSTIISYCAEFITMYDGPTTGSPQVGKYCGDKIPLPYLSMSNQVLIVYKGLHANTFTINYEAVCGRKFTAETGEIYSSDYPKMEIVYVDCIYEIELTPGKTIMLNIVEFASLFRSSSTVIEVRDGNNKNAPLLLSSNSSSNYPLNVVSTHNHMWINLLSSWLTMKRKYYMNYTSLDVGCGGILTKDFGVIQSPSHPNVYPNDLSCKWLIQAPQNHVIQLTFLNFKLEQSLSCRYDYVTIYDINDDTENHGFIGTFCGSKVPPTLLSSSNMIRIKFKSDNSHAREGFMASYIFVSEENVCGGTYFTNSGIMKSPRYPNPYPVNKNCKWIIHVQPGRQIMLNITDFQLESYSNCRYDFLEIRNGGTAASPLIGKYCGNTIPKVIYSHANQLYIYFKTDMSRNGKGFMIYWSSASTGCGGTLTSPKGSIISPHYPEPYNRNTECYWRISINAGSIIQIVFADLDLEPHLTCYLDYVEVFDGKDMSAKSLGRFCSTHPPYIRSTSNHMVIKFRSDVSFQGRGFQIQYSTVCQNTLTGFSGVIESPNFPNRYPQNEDCTWTVGVTEGNKINVTFSHFELERSLSYNDVKCIFDYVEFIYTDRDTEEENKYTFCDVAIPPPITINSNTTHIHFVSDNLLMGNGFRLEWVIFGCGGILTHPTGRFSSPNYPRHYPTSTRCDWIIQVPYGNSIAVTFKELDIEHNTVCMYDFIQIYNGRDDKAPLMNQLCHTNKPITITSSGHNMLVLFQSDSSFEGQGFEGTYKTVPSKCGGILKASTGTFMSPNYPKNYDRGDVCEWLIEIEEIHVIELVFLDFDMPYSTYVKVYDGPTSAYPVLAYLLGDSITNGTIRSTHNHLFVEMVTSNNSLLTAKGFKASYSTACGAILNSETTGIINFRPPYRLYVEYCQWTIIAPDPSQHVYLTFSYLTAYYCDYNMNEIIVYNGFNSSAPRIGQYCEKVPHTITSTGSMLHIDANMGFKATYSTLSTICGGSLEDSSGYFATPNYPDNYPINIQCEWTVNISHSMTTSITFSTFDLLESEHCNDDFVEIRENDNSGKLLGVFCGKNVPTNIAVLGRIWIMFKSNQPDPGEVVTTGKGFMAEYLLMEHTNFYEPSGTISSPLYPDYFVKSGMYSWRITVKFGYKIAINILDLSMEYADDYCFTNYLAFYDGYDSNGPELRKICGVSKVSFKTSSNMVYVEMISDSPRKGVKFAFEWLQVEDIKNETTSTKITDTCGNKEVININPLRNYTLKSPGYPGGYAASLTCEWIFSTIPENHLQLDFYTVDLEYRVPCLFDKVQVYSGKGGIENWQLVGTVCLPNDTYRDTIETTNLMKVVFKTDYYLNQTGFSAMVTDACGGSVEKRNGVITVDNSTFSKMYGLECQWNISVRTGRTMNVKFLIFDVGGNKDSKCKNYILLKNGQTADSPILGNGKYCGEVTPTNLQTTSNHLYVKFSTRTKVRGFTMEYSEVSVDCDASISLTYEDNTKYISSPNYPNIPLPHTECQWIISTAPGEAVQIDFVERFDLTYTPDCYKEYVEIRNGGTIISPLIGRYCESMPNTLITSDNIAFLKFFTDVEDPRNGFKIKLTIAKCGGTIRDSTGTIQSRYFNKKKLFPKNENCSWEIEGPEGHFIIINFETLDLPTFIGNCTTSYVEIVEHSIRNYNELTSIGKYCQENPPEVKALSNKVLIRFVTGPRNIQAAGFSLNFNATKEKCGGKLTAESGYITSPRYPFMFPTKCDWIIEVTKGRRVQVELLDLDFDMSEPSQGLAFSNAESFAGHITVIKAGDNTKIINSTDNIMYIFFWAIYTSNHRGFKLKYSSDEPTVCLGDFSLRNSTIYSPRNISFYYCSWKRIEHDPSPRTLVLKIDIQDAMKSGVPTPSRCKHTRTYLLITAGNDDMELGQICSLLGKPEIIRIPYPTTEIIGNKLGRSPVFDFVIDYRTYQCGGIIKGEDGNITSPGFPKRTSEIVECAWLIELPEDQTVRLKFEVLDLGDDCEKSFVIIYNGKLNTSPRLGKYCKTTFPQTIQSQSNHLWIDYHSETSAGKGFNITYEAQSSGCGGIFHSTRLIQTPSYPDNYPNNAECVWEVRGAVGYHIGLEFLGRFQMEKTDDCKNDFVQVWDYKNDDWLSLGRWCGREAPKFLNSSTTQMKIMFRSNEEKSGTGFKAKWVLNCGGNFTATPSLQYITSPGYPNKYDDDLNCVYNISAPGKYILIKFDDFNLEIGNPNCPYDSVAITYTVYGIVKTQSYCGFNKPPDLTVKNEVSIRFKTDMFVKKSGFKFYFTTDSCGGDISSPTEISSPEYVVNSFYGHTRLYKCYWNITAPTNKVVAVKFDRISTQDSRHCWYNYLSLYNTFNTSLENRLVKFCGNLTYNVPTMRSTDNKMLLEYRSYNNKNNFFKASVYFTYGPKSGCGGAIIMDINDRKNIQEPNLRGQLDCQWVIQASEGYYINVEVSTLPSCQLPGINATNHLEIRNGGSHFSELIVDLCNTQKSIHEFSTSLPQAFIQWSTLDSKGNTNGFAITLSTSKSQCGQIYLMANETTQYITSPNYPEKYPDNIKCVWKINSTTPYKHLLLKLIDFDLGENVDSSAECIRDKLEIVDKENRRVIDEGLGSQAIYYFGRTGPVYKGLRRPIGVHQYCGQTATEFDYYSGEGNVIVSLHSGGGVHGRGFKLGYAIVGGCRNYTSAQGRLYNNNVTDCGFTLTTPENTTISLYFMRFVGFFKAHTTECGSPKMEIYDGDSDKATKLATHCSFTLPNPIFSTQNKLFIKVYRGKYSFAYYDITYTSTTEGRGCGGKIYNYKGTFTSPMYPNSYRKLSYCRWEVTVPYGLRISLTFTVFDIRASCDSDYLQVSTYNVDENSQKFCPYDTIPVFEATNKIVVEYWTSLQNGGTGWVAHFAGFTDDQSIQW